MKNKITYLIVLIFAFSFYYESLAQNRRVDWLHGFGANSSNWAGYATRFAVDRKMESFTPGYTTTGTITSIILAR